MAFMVPFNLLVKYMQMVIDAESISFLMNEASGVKFDEEEWRILKMVEVLATNALRERKKE